MQQANQLEQSLSVVIDAAMKMGGIQVLDSVNLVRGRFFTMTKELEAHKEEKEVA